MRYVWIMFGAVTTMALPAVASPVTWEFAGEITHVVDRDNLLDGAVAVGSPFSGSFTFESTTPDSDPDDPVVGLYDSAILGFSGQIAELPFDMVANSVTNFILVWDLSPPLGSDRYLARFDAHFSGEVLDLGVQFLDTTMTVFSDDSLPVDAPRLSDLTVAEFIIVDLSETHPFSISGRIDVLVPEPAMLSLLGVAGAMLAAFRRRPLPSTKKSAANHRTPCAHRVLPFVALMAGVLLLGGERSVRAADCNNNGVDDAIELPDCPTIDVVFFIDTSLSTRFEIANVCNGIEQAIHAVRQGGLTLNARNSSARCSETGG